MYAPVHMIDPAGVRSSCLLSAKPFDDHARASSLPASSRPLRLIVTSVELVAAIDFTVEHSE
jgi:hypothetical protein